MRYKIRYTLGKEAGMCPGINSFSSTHPIEDHTSWNQQLIGFEVEGSFDTARRGAVRPLLGLCVCKVRKCGGFTLQTAQDWKRKVCASPGSEMRAVGWWPTAAGNASRLAKGAGDETNKSNFAKRTWNVRRNQ